MATPSMLVRLAAVVGGAAGSVWGSAANARRWINEGFDLPPRPLVDAFPLPEADGRSHPTDSCALTPPDPAKRLAELRAFRDGLLLDASGGGPYRRKNRVPPHS